MIINICGIVKGDKYTPIVRRADNSPAPLESPWTQWNQHGYNIQLNGLFLRTIIWMIRYSMNLIDSEKRKNNNNVMILHY